MLIVSPQRRRRASRPWLAFGLGSLIASCGGEAEPASRDVVSVETQVGAQQGLEVEFTMCDAGSGKPCGRLNGSVNLSMVACSAVIRCQDGVMHDPETLERAPTLVSGISCGFPDGTPPQDAMLSYHPEIRCYRGGDPDDRTTWEPADGIAVEPEWGEHLFFSQEASDVGDVFTNAAQLLRPLREASYLAEFGSYGFCELHAWGDIAFSDRLDNRPRRAEHVPFAPAVEWRAIVRWTGAGWDCNTTGTPSAPARTWVRRVVLVSATHDLPDNTLKGSFPVAHDVVLIREEALPHEIVAGLPPESQNRLGARLAFAESSAFPEEAHAAPAGMTERVLWVGYPSASLAADMKVDWSCAEITEDGVERIGLLVSDRVLHVPLGAIVVWRDTGDAPPREGVPVQPPRSWDCEREDGGACRLLELSEWSALTPCLLPAAPLP